MALVHNPLDLPRGDRFADLAALMEVTPRDLLSPNTGAAQWAGLIGMLGLLAGERMREWGKGGRGSK